MIMSQTPLISVVIPNYNYGRYLPEAIDSVLAQSYSNTEIVVVDDGSTDNSEDVLRNYEDRVRWFSQRNQGVSTARNAGVEKSRGELIAFLDADDVWLPNKLALQAERILTDEGLGLVHCGVEEFCEGDHITRLQLNGLEGWVAREILLPGQLEMVAISSGSLLTREAFLSAGGFDPRLSTSADIDLAYRVATGHRIGFVPEVLARIRMHNTNMHRTNIQVLEHDMLLFYSKVFSNAEPAIRKMRRQCYGNLHLALGGSYFRARRPFSCARHLIKSLYFRPQHLKYIVQFPLRWRRRWSVTH